VRRRPRARAPTCPPPRGGAGRVMATTRVAERLAGSARLSLTEVLEATGGELRNLGRYTGFAGVTTDTRGIEAGELFVAVRGESRDGHDFLDDAARAGAGGVVV